MHKTVPYRQISATMLMGIYLSFWSLLSLHHFIHHDHHHEQKTCHHAPNEKHLHSEEYAGLDCSICQIAPSLAEPPIFSGLALRQPVSVKIDPVFGERSFFSASPYTLSQPRAPPVRPA